MRPITNLLAFFTLAFGLASDAGNDSGNGGYGVIIDGKTYSLDLAAKGVHLKPFAPTTGPYSLGPAEVALIQRKLGDIEDKQVLEIIELKLATLKEYLKKYEINYPLIKLIYNMTRFAFSFHKDLPCKLLPENNLPYPNKVQLAYRLGDQVRFCKAFFDADRANQAGNLTHELFYAGHTDEKAKTTTKLVGFMFHPDFEKLDAFSAQELRGYLSDLSTKSTFRGSIYEVKEVGDISSEVIEELSVPVGLSPCFGKLEDLERAEGTGLYLWFIFSGSDCPLGRVEPLYVFALRRGEDNSHFLYAKQEASTSTPGVLLSPIGILKDKNTLDVLCSGPFKDGCEIDYGRGVITYGKNPNFFYVDEIWSIHPSVVPALDVPKGYAPCFGITALQPTESLEKFALWLVKDGEECQLGAFYSRYGRTFLKRAYGPSGTFFGEYISKPKERWSNVGRPHLVPVGYANVDPNHGPKSLWYLCNGTYTGLCKMKNGSELTVFNEDETIFSAARTGHLERVEYLIGKDPSLINATDPTIYSDARPILTMAALREWGTNHKDDEEGPRIVEWLISKGADVNRRDRWGKTPLYWCEENFGNPKSCALIRAAGGTR